MRIGGIIWLLLLTGCSRAGIDFSTGGEPFFDTGIPGTDEGLPANAEDTWEASCDRALDVVVAQGPQADLDLLASGAGGWSVLMDDPGLDVQVGVLDATRDETTGITFVEGSDVTAMGELLAQAPSVSIEPPAVLDRVTAILDATVLRDAELLVLAWLDTPDASTTSTADLTQWFDDHTATEASDFWLAAPVDVQQPLADALLAVDGQVRTPDFDVMQDAVAQVMNLQRFVQLRRVPVPSSVRVFTSSPTLLERELLRDVDWRLDGGGANRVTLLGYTPRCDTSIRVTYRRDR